MNNYRYSLDKTSRKFKCPACGKKTFVLYRDSQSDEYMEDEFGRCDREDNCGHQCYPAGLSKSDSRSYTQKKMIKPAVMARTEKVEFLPTELITRSMVKYYENNFVIYLKSLFGDDLASDLINKYMIGTSKLWPGATIFWQVDISGNTRQCKVMLYEPTTGKRVKDEIEPKIKFLGKQLLGNYDAYLQQCFFGEHLLAKFPDLKVAICESEKTAIIASAYLPEYIWIATGGKQGCSLNKPSVCKVIDGRNVTLFPDLNAYCDWSAKSINMKKLTTAKIKISDVLERNANLEQKQAGYDLADFMIVRNEVSGVAIGINGYPVSWDHISKQINN